MCQFAHLIVFALAITVLTNGAALTSRSAGAMMSKAVPKAVYFITNEVNNGVVALPVAKDGTLSTGSITATGGAGGTQVNAKTGEPTVPDALSSQGSVRVAGNMVFAVNAGSNTLSMFTIDAVDATKLTLLGQPVNTAGDFPVTLAVSTRHKLACVGNTGAKAGIACASFSAKTGLSAMDTLRPFSLNQVTPPTGPLNTVADTFFNGNQSVLFTTIKGDPTVNNTGFLSAFSVTPRGKVSTQETRSSPAGTAVLFGTVGIPGTNNLLATDASFGAAIIGLSGGTAPNKGTVLASAKIADQAATCWATVSHATKTGFVTDVAVNHLIEIDVTTGAIIKELALANGNPGMIDLEAAGKFIYALSPGSANATSKVAVFDVSGGKGNAKAIQNFGLKGVGPRAQGMAVLK